MLKKIGSLLIIAALTALPAASQGQGNGGQGYGKGNQGKGMRGRGDGFDGGMADLLNSLPAENLSNKERKGLLRMREEEKLARDVYLTLYETWKQRIFRNIARSEQRHMDAVGVLLEKYAIIDPVIDDSIGVFADQQLQNLYYDLTATGSLSLQDALLVGATIEDLDIFDLKTFLSATNNIDIQILYQNLLKGSRNHLRSFYERLFSSGICYAAQYLSQEEVDAILDTPMERGVYNEKGEPYFGNPGW